MGRTLRLGSFAGVELEADAGWVAAFALASWTVALVASSASPAFAPVVLAVSGMVGSAVLFVSVTLHALASAAASAELGVPVRTRIVSPFGAVREIDRPSSPRTEAIPAVLAVLVSAGVGTFGLLASVAFYPVQALFPLSALFGLVGIVNLGIAAVQLVPALPLSGGRLFRALVWRVTGDFDRASRWAAWTGELVGGASLLCGVMLVFVYGRGALGLWFAFGGWSLASEAARSYAAVAAQTRSVRARDLGPTVRGAA